MDGASQPEELIHEAARLGIPHLGLADRDSVYGLVQAHKAAADTGVHLVCGATLTVQDHPAVTLLVQNMTGWSRLCRLLTVGRAGQDKGWAKVTVEDLAAHSAGLFCLLRPGWSREMASWVGEAFGDRVRVVDLDQQIEIVRRRGRRPGVDTTRVDGGGRLEAPHEEQHQQQPSTAGRYMCLSGPFHGRSSRKSASKP